MIKFRILVIGLLGYATAIAYAKQPLLAQPIVHEMNLGGCHFKMRDPFNGRTSGPNSAAYFATMKHRARYPFETSIQFTCENPANAKTLSDRAGIKMTSKGWGLDSSPESLGPREVHTPFHPLHGEGWNGGGVTQDGTNGDEERHTRIYAFCIPHDQLALCGIVRHVGYLRHLDESVLPQVLKLLESVEFSDAPAPASPGSSATP